MPEFVTGITDPEEKVFFALPSSSAASPQIHVADMEENERRLIEKTRAMTPCISSLSFPPEPSLAGRVSVNPTPSSGLKLLETHLTADLEQLQEVEQRIAEGEDPHTLDFPNLALEALKAGLEKERISNNQIDHYIKDAEKHQGDIDLLLDCSAELGAHKDDAEISEKLKAILARLKERGIDLWKSEEKTLSKEKIIELKSLSNAQVDQLRSKLQIIFASKLPGLIQATTTIIQTIQEIVRSNSKLIESINRKMTGR